MTKAVADSDLDIALEQHSHERAKTLSTLVWKAARELQIEEFRYKFAQPIFDDHIPFLDAGVPAILLIDYEYKWWHTHGDTVDRCSAVSCEKIGRVVLRSIRELDQR